VMSLFRARHRLSDRDELRLELLRNQFDEIRENSDKNRLQRRGDHSGETVAQGRLREAPLQLGRSEPADATSPIGSRQAGCIDPTNRFVFSSKLAVR
jgi:hypothetical protein